MESGAVWRRHQHFCVIIHWLDYYLVTFPELLTRNQSQHELRWTYLFGFVFVRHWHLGLLGKEKLVWAERTHY